MLARSNGSAFDEAITRGHRAAGGCRALRRILLAFASFFAAARRFAHHPSATKTRSFTGATIHRLATIERHFRAIASRGEIARRRILREAGEKRRNLIRTFHRIARNLLGT